MENPLPKNATQTDQWYKPQSLPTRTTTQQQLESQEQPPTTPNHKSVNNVSNINLVFLFKVERRIKIVEIFFSDLKRKGKTHIEGLFGIHLFCWNWKFFTESIVDKSKS